MTVVSTRADQGGEPELPVKAVKQTALTGPHPDAMAWCRVVVAMQMQDAVNDVKNQLARGS